MSSQPEEPKVMEVESPIVLVSIIPVEKNGLKGTLVLRNRPETLDTILSLALQVNGKHYLVTSDPIHREDLTRLWRSQVVSLWQSVVKSVVDRMVCELLPDDPDIVAGCGARSLHD